MSSLLELGSNLDNSQKELLGKKALNLHILLSEDYPVPKGFVLTTPLQYCEDQLVRQIERIGGFPVAVRSSGQLENLSGASFAGLYESYLNINSVEELITSLYKCEASAKSERVQSYLKKKKYQTKNKNNFSILVQKMVSAKKSGVLFSINPLSGREEEALAEICKGLGEKLVSGHVNPTRLCLNYFNNNLETQEIGDEGVEIQVSQRNALKDLALKLQEFFGRPQDIEFCIDHEEKIWVVQSRAITQVKWRNEVDEFTNADLKDGGVSARVCTPMMYSLYNWTFSASMNQHILDLGLPARHLGKSWMIHRYGRVYWNASWAKKTLINIPGFNEKDFDQNLGIEKDYGTSGPVITPSTPWKLVKAIPVLINLHREFKACQKETLELQSSFETVNKQWLDSLKLIKDLDDASFNQKMLEMLNQFYFPHEKHYFRIIANNSNFQSEFSDLIEKLAKKLSITIDRLKLLSGISSISHIQIEKDLFILTEKAKEYGLKTKEFQRELNLFLDKHYHHGQAELDLTQARWSEKPDFLVNLIKTRMNIPNPSPWKLEAKQINSFTEHVKSIEQKFTPVQFLIQKKFKKYLKLARFFISHREGVREISTKCYFIVRKYLLEVNRRYFNDKKFKNKEIVFYLHIEELLQALNNSNFRNFDPLIKLRFLFYQAYRDFDSPNEFGGKVKQTSQYLEADQGLFKGIACSGGSFQGIAKIINSIEEQDNLHEGEILVTKFTDPSWTPLLVRAKAVITEVGGVLSHAAVISREYGIPAVLNVKNITQLIESGQKIIVDGDEGTIKVMDN
jgi:phosphohistidine swiveling domain-containing protein